MRWTNDGPAGCRSPETVRQWRLCPVQLLAEELPPAAADRAFRVCAPRLCAHHMSCGGILEMATAQLKPESGGVLQRWRGGGGTAKAAVLLATPEIAGPKEVCSESPRPARSVLMPAGSGSVSSQGFRHCQAPNNKFRTPSALLSKNKMIHETCVYC